MNSLRGLPKIGVMIVIGLAKGLGNDRLDSLQWLQHVDVLRALSRIEERDFRGGTVPAENSLRAQGLPHGGLVRSQGFQGSRRFGR